MSIEIAGITFDRVNRDADGDVLYLHHGDPSTAVDFNASSEGHALRFDLHGDLVGITIVSARSLLDHEGQVTATIPGSRADPPGRRPADEHARSGVDTFRLARWPQAPRPSDALGRSVSPAIASYARNPSVTSAI